MRILYAIQGTGNGHLSRATDIVPLLQQFGELDILVSGKSADVSIPFEINYRMNGLSFVFGKKGDIDFWKTLRNIDAYKLWKEISSLPVNKYDLIVNDFEPISAWAAKLRNVPCYSLSHQSAVANKKSPKPNRNDWFGMFILKYYAPTSYQYGFHFEPYDHQIFTPVIRQQVRKQEIRNDGHYTVYLPAYGDETLVRKLKQFQNVQWEVFSKHSKQTYCVENVSITPINNESFIKSMATCEGMLCGAGFETPAEALFMKKKLMVVPMKSQYEQRCNAASLKQLGVPVLRNLKDKNLHKIDIWLKNDSRIMVDYSDNTQSIIRIMIEHYFSKKPQTYPSHELMQGTLKQVAHF